MCHSGSVWYDRGHEVSNAKYKGPSENAHCFGAVWVVLLCDMRFVVHASPPPLVLRPAWFRAAWVVSPEFFLPPLRFEDACASCSGGIGDARSVARRWAVPRKLLPAAVVVISRLRRGGDGEERVIAPSTIHVLGCPVELA